MKKLLITLVLVLALTSLAHANPFSSTINQSDKSRIDSIISGIELKKESMGQSSFNTFVSRLTNMMGYFYYKLSSLDENGGVDLETPNNLGDDNNNSECIDPGLSVDPWNIPSSCNMGKNIKVINHSISDETNIIWEKTSFSDRDITWNGSINFGDIWAVRNYYSSNKGEYMSVKFRPQETGEDTSLFEIAISKIPGSFTKTLDENGNEIDLSQKCIKKDTLGGGSVSSSISTLDKYSPPEGIKFIEKYCLLDSNSMYYVNIKSLDPECGKSKKCRFLTKAAWPHIGEEYWKNGTTLVPENVVIFKPSEFIPKSPTRIYKPEDGMLPGVIYAAEFKDITQEYFNNTEINLDIVPTLRAGYFEPRVDVFLSYTPGVEGEVGKGLGCQYSNIMNKRVYINSTWGANDCDLDPTKGTYYVNIKMSDDSQNDGCGTTKKCIKTAFPVGNTPTAVPTPEPELESIEKEYRWGEKELIKKNAKMYYYYVDNADGTKYISSAYSNVGWSNFHNVGQKCSASQNGKMFIAFDEETRYGLEILDGNQVNGKGTLYTGDKDKKYDVYYKVGDKYKIVCKEIKPDLSTPTPITGDSCKTREGTITNHGKSVYQYYKMAGYTSCIDAVYKCNNGNLIWGVQASPAPPKPSSGTRLYDEYSSCEGISATTTPTTCKQVMGNFCNKNTGKKEDWYVNTCESNGPDGTGWNKLQQTLEKDGNTWYSWHKASDVSCE